MRIRNQILGIIKVFRKTGKIPVFLERNGLTHTLYLIYICFILPVIMKVLPIYLKVYAAVRRRRQKYVVDEEIRNWQSKKEELLHVGKRGYRIQIEDFGLSQEKLDLLKKIQKQSNEVVIAEIDQDGFLLSHFGPIKNVPTISKKKYLQRELYKRGRAIKVVAINGYVGVKKCYGNDKVSFANEMKALHNLGLAGCNVPAIINVDFDNLTLTLSYIAGSVLREELAKKGAVLRNRDVDNNPDSIYLTPEERWLKCIQEGKRVLYDVIDSQFVESLFTELNKIHASGFTWHDIKYGNIIIEKKSLRPYLIDFESAENYSNLGKNSFRILRDQNIEKFNLHFDTERLTYKIIKKRIKSRNLPSIDEWYSPVYFDAGLRIGQIWDANVGYGRWHFILKHNLPSLSGKRILDLGANNGFISIQMLRNGAREVIGIEKNSNYIAQGNFVKAAFEWADNKQYNFRYIQGDMTELPKMNLGKFDMVIALCSLYYLDDDSISNTIQYVKTITDVFILQCNIAVSTARKSPHTYEKASLEYAVKALKSNGFPNIQVIAPHNYSRPLVIGKKEKTREVN